MSSPKRLDSVWHETHKNGYIKVILWEDDRDVIVFFYNGQIEEVLSWDLFDNYNERLNQWIIHTV